MDNGQVQKPMNARDLTAEIDRETGGVVFETQDFGEFQGDSGESIDISDTRAQNLGRGAILSRGEREEIAAEVDISRAENAVKNPGEFSGVQTPVEIAEEERLNAENLRNEKYPKGSYEAKIASGNQRKITEGIAQMVDEMTRKSGFELSDLDKVYRGGVQAMMSTLGEKVGGQE